MQDWKLSYEIGNYHARLKIVMRDWKLSCKKENRRQEWNSFAMRKIGNRVSAI